MLRKIGLFFKNAFFWRYARGTWQYDLMVAAILLFIFLTPRRLFHDAPLPFSISDRVVQESSDNNSEKVYLLRAEVFSRYKDFQHNQSFTRAVEEELQKELRHPVKVTRVEPLFDADQKLEGFRVRIAK